MELILRLIIGLKILVYENGYNTYTFVHGDNNDRILVNLSMLGKHNILNSLVAMAVADYMGLDLMKAAKSFEALHGTETEDN